MPLPSLPSSPLPSSPFLSWLSTLLPSLFLDIYLLDGLFGMLLTVSDDPCSNKAVVSQFADPETGKYNTKGAADEGTDRYFKISFALLFFPSECT